MGRIVVLESPLAGKTFGDVQRNIRYGRAALADSLRRGECPMASHLLYALPGVLDDRDARDRATGMEAGMGFYRVAEGCVVYMDRGISGGMDEGIQRALKRGVSVEYRRVPWWKP